MEGLDVKSPESVREYFSVKKWMMLDYRVLKKWNIYHFTIFEIVFIQNVMKYQLLSLNLELE